MAQLKQLLLGGRHQEAILLYQQRAGVDAKQAQGALSDLGRHLSFDTMRSQTLTAYGLGLVAVSAALLLVSIAAGLAGKLHPLLALGLAGFGALNLFFYAPAIRTTLQFWGAQTASATVVKLAPIGVVKVGRQQVHTFKFLLDVHPTSGESFHAELLVPVREKSLQRAQPGAEILVKYLAHDPTRLIFYRSVTSA